jgi:hypothetical protein
VVQHGGGSHRKEIGGFPGGDLFGEGAGAESRRKNQKNTESNIENILQIEKIKMKIKK